MVKTFLKSGPINEEAISGLINSLKKDKSAGAHSVFLGQVRADILNGKTVMGIEYSAYEGMVNIEAERIVAEIILEFKDVKTIDILHSSGMVKAGEISLLIIVSAGHRQNATAACTKTIELVKERLPVWKKEIFEDNSHEWK